MTIDRAKAAHAEPQQGSHDWDVVVTFSAHQKREFGRVTTAAVGHELAILDNARLISAPTVAEPIHSGTLEITGLTKAHARRLAHALNSG
jgi:preprotein translocase subunit SecD